jgi:alpha-D-ribose 1-methylphosphonate 5-triphosphate diphosphatase
MNLKQLQEGFSIVNARVVTPKRVLDPGGIRIESGLITDIGPVGNGINHRNGEEFIDVKGALLLPGFVDIHADSLEVAIAPRPTAPFTPETVLAAYDAELALHGITTVFHCVGLADLGDFAKPLRTRPMASKIVKDIRAFTPHALLRTFIHLRYEITDTDSLAVIAKMIETGLVDLVSLMDHTPGFGVFKDIDAYRDYFRRSGLTIAAADAKFSELTKRRQNVNETSLQEVVALCHQHHLTVVSHDDHTVEKLQWALDLGLSVAEFPVTLQAVDFARANGMATVFGTPNLIRGRSHAGNLSVTDMISSHRVDVLCLDYAPMSLLPAFFKVAKLSGASLSQVSHLFSLNPAKCVGLDGVTGSIEIGKAADLIVVDNRRKFPRVLATFVNGKSVYQNHLAPV